MTIGTKIDRALQRTKKAFDNGEGEQIIDELFEKAKRNTQSAAKKVLRSINKKR